MDRLQLPQGFWKKLPPTNVLHPLENLVVLFDDSLPFGLESLSHCTHGCGHCLRRVNHPVTKAFLKSRVYQLEKEFKGVQLLRSPSAETNVYFTVVKAMKHFDVDLL